MNHAVKSTFVMAAAFISIILLIVARHHPPSRRKIKEIWHGRVYWGPNSTMLRAPLHNETLSHFKSSPTPEKDESETPVINATNDVPAAISTAEPTIPKIDIELAVIVLTARDFKDRRNVIRETWGNGHSNIFFIVGKHCPYRPDQRQSWVCEPKNANAIIDEHYNAQQESLTVQLSKEPNVIVVDMIDVYRHLAEKLKLAYLWLVEHTEAKYVLKMDDDSFARVDSVQHWLMNRVNPPKYEIIAGRFGVGVGVVRGGKWAEKKYKPNKYPPWPTGAGHIVSRPVIEYLCLNVDTWVSYQGEDTSLGIWMEKVRPQMNVHRTSSEHFITHSGDCHNKNKFVIGHKISIKKMRECYTTLDEYDHITKNMKSENDLKKESVDKSVDKYGTIHLKVTANEPDDNIKSQNNWKKKIDIVIPSSLGSAPSKEIERTRTGDHSIYWQLISISKNAPWIRKIFILVNGNQKCPYKLPSNINVTFVNRCDYMGHCPTKNSMAVYTMMHRIPGLSEHFISTQDDIMLGRTVTPLDFFTSDGKPFSWRAKPTWSDGIMGVHHRIYIKPEVFKGKVPTSAAPMPHFMYPMLKSYAAELAETYKDWYAFVESHKEGRFSSQTNSINDKRNSQEEDILGVWDSNLITSKRGVYKNINSKRGSLWDEVSISKVGFEKVIRTKPMFLNVNDRFSKDPVEYKKQIKWFWDSMEKLFGVQLKWKDVSELNTSDELKQDKPLGPEKYLEKNLDTFFMSLPESSQFTGDVAMQKSVPTKQWLPEFKKRSSKRTAAQNAALSNTARFKAKHFVGGLRALEDLGYRPVLRDGTLISALRHRGWIDFGGTKYQTGYDIDPDALLDSESCTKLNNNPKVGVYTWKPYISLSAYVKRHCASPAKTIDFYKTTLGMDVEQANGGELWFEDTLVVDFSSFYKWKYDKSYIYAMCWRAFRNSKPKSSFALLLHDDDIYPIQHVDFYDYTVPIPNNAVDILKKQWGDDVLTTVRIKKTSGRGSSADSYALPSGHAPAVPLGPCLPDSRFDTLEWYNEYAEKVRMVRPFPRCETCLRTADAGAYSMKNTCVRWWHSTPQRRYTDLPTRKWSEVLRPKNHIVPACSFGQKEQAKHSCYDSHTQLFEALARLRVVYFPRSGTELGIVRQSAYISEDGDLDIYVDMPQKMLLEKLKNEITSGTLHRSGREVHWKVPGCPEVHLLYDDWISDEMSHRATPEDLCSCRMNSVELMCHKNAPQRMYIQYGPSWKTPLGLKQLDMPYWASTHKTHGWITKMKAKLQSLVNKESGVIDKLPGGVRNPLALAQLNIMLKNIS